MSKRRGGIALGLAWVAAWVISACGAGPDDLPPMPAPRRHTAVVVRMPECKTFEIMGKAEREHTPPELAAWLVELARRCNTMKEAA